MQHPVQWCADLPSTNASTPDGAVTLRTIALTVVLTSIGTAGLAQALRADELAAVNKLDPIACLATIDDLPNEGYSVSSSACSADIFDYCLARSGVVEATECFEITNGHIRAYYTSFLQKNRDGTGLNPLIRRMNERAMVQIADTVTNPSANCDGAAADPKVLCQSFEMHIAALQMFMVTRSRGIDVTYPVDASP